MLLQLLLLGSYIEYQVTEAHFDSSVPLNLTTLTIGVLAAYHLARLASIDIELFPAECSLWKSWKCKLQVTESKVAFPICRVMLLALRSLSVKYRT